MGYNAGDDKILIKYQMDLIKNKSKVCHKNIFMFVSVLLCVINEELDLQSIGTTFSEVADPS